MKKYVFSIWFIIARFQFALYVTTAATSKCKPPLARDCQNQLWSFSHLCIHHQLRFEFVPNRTTEEMAPVTSGYDHPFSRAEHFSLQPSMKPPYDAMAKFQSLKARLDVIAGDLLDHDKVDRKRYVIDALQPWNDLAAVYDRERGLARAAREGKRQLVENDTHRSMDIFNALLDHSELHDREVTKHKVCCFPDVVHTFSLFQRLCGLCT